MALRPDTLRDKLPAGKHGRGTRTAADPAGGATQRIVDAITSAIVERRLMPGTKLAEQQIADIFKVSRTLVRQALNQLSRDHLVTLEPARGAFVAQPSVEEARQVFEVRKMIEASLVRQLCAVAITDAQIGQLRQHLAAEAGRGAHRRDGPHRLLADFHVVLARLLGNEVLAQLLADLLSRCSLIALMYQSRTRPSTRRRTRGHRRRIERRDARAAAADDSHLGNVERNLQLHPRAGRLAICCCHPPEHFNPCATRHDCLALPPRPARLRPQPPHARWPGQAPRGRAVRAELRRRRREQPAARRPHQRDLPVRTGHRPGLREPPHDDGVDVRIRLARGRVAHPARVRAARPAADRVRRRLRAGALPRTGGALHGARRRDRQPRPALDPLPAHARGHRAPHIGVASACCAN
jgi:DNA-binding GntR family transcriptional regulator